jgi:nicotinamide-nucleotide amidase
MQTLKITLLMTGNEIIQGDILDTNSQYLSKSFAECQLSIASILTIGDDPIQLTEEIQRISQSADLLIINGGMGPTRDDHTSSALADALNEPLITNDKALAHVNHWLKERGHIENDPKQLKQAYFPTSASFLGNPSGSAPAYSVKLNQCLIIPTPGVPRELRSITKELILPLIMKTFSLPPQSPWHKALLFGIYESRLEKHLENSIENLDAFEFGFRVDTPYLEFKYRLPVQASKEQKRALSKEIQEAIAPYLVSTEGVKLPEQLFNLLLENKATVSTAESCTGGLTAHLLTQIPDSSKVLEGGVISYSNTLKEKYLQVSPKTLEKYGAVSKETVREMLEGLLHTTNSTYGIAITGIAGPSGGTSEKPLGTVYIAYGKKASPQIVHLVVHVHRQLFQQFIALCAMDLLKALIQQQPAPSYIERYSAKTKK